MRFVLLTLLLSLPLCVFAQTAETNPSPQAQVERNYRAIESYQRAPAMFLKLSETIDSDHLKDEIEQLREGIRKLRE